MSFSRVSIPMCWFLLTLLLTPGYLLAQPTETEMAFVVHLPSREQRNAQRFAEAIASLAQVISDRVPDMTLSVKLFKRWSDASEFIAENQRSTAIVLTDGSFLLDLPSGLKLEPKLSMVRSGETTYQRVVIVKSESPATKLADLKGTQLVVAATTGASLSGFLSNRVFGPPIDVDEWFRTVSEEADDSAVTAAVLYGNMDAGLVAAFDPLLTSHLGTELRIVFTSQEIPLPVVSINSSLWSPMQISALSEISEAIPDDTLSTLGVEGLKSSTSLQGRLHSKEMSFVLPDPDSARPGTARELPLPSVDQLAFRLLLVPPSGGIPIIDDE